MKIVTITPHRNRVLQLRNHLRSLAYQTRKPDQVVVVSHGDVQETRRAIVDLMAEHLEDNGLSMQYWAVGEPSDPWRKPLAINWAIRRTVEDVDVIATIDVDMILHPQTIEVLEQALLEDPRRYVMCPNLSLGQELCDELSDEKWTYEGLRSHAHFLTWHGAREEVGPMSMGWGGLQAAMREWWFSVRGLDEEMQWWGPEDHDLAKRAAFSLKWHWIGRPYSLLHQWHEPGQAGPKAKAEIKEWIMKNLRISRDKLRRGFIIRNPSGWGGLPS